MKAQLRGNFIHWRTCFAQEHAGFVVDAVAQDREGRFPASLVATAGQMRGGNAQSMGIFSDAVIRAIAALDQIGKCRNKAGRRRARA